MTIRSILLGCCVVVATITLGSPAARADGMMVPHNPNVKIFEPRQEAIVAWNGVEEILILRVVVRASGATGALHVVPFPTEPRVTKGSADAFARAVRLINRDQQARADGIPPPSARSKPSLPPPSAGEVTMHQTIGVHDVTVAHVLSKGGFVEWVTKAIKQSSGEPVTVSAQNQEIVAQYVASGIEWFVFDHLQLSEQFGQTEPLEYRFATPRLFYPLRITNVSAASDVELTVLSQSLLRKFVGLEGHRVKRLHEPATLPIEVVRTIDPDLAELFAASQHVNARLWRIKDYYGGFTKDLIAL